MKKIGFKLSTFAVGLALHAQAQEVTDQELEPSTIIADNMPDDMIDVEPSFNTKFVTPLVKVPRSVDVITNKQFTDRGAQSVQDATAYTAGVYAGPFGVDSRLDDSNIRGVSPLRFLDGFQSHFGFYNTTRPDIYTLESIDVVKGPASVLFGQGAVGGIINNNSKLPQEESHHEIQIQYGNFNRRQAAIDSTGALNADGTLLYRLVGVLRESDTQTDSVIDDAAIFMPSITWKPNENTSLTFLANIQDNNGGSTLQFLPVRELNAVGIDVSSDTFIGEESQDRYDTETQAFSLFFDHKFNDTFSVSANARYSQSDSYYFYHQVIPASLAPAFMITLPDGQLARFGYLSELSSDIFSANLIGKAEFATGNFDHKFQIGLDLVEVSTTDDRPNILPGFRGFFPTTTAFDFNTGNAFNFFGGSTLADIPESNSTSDFDATQVGLFFGDVIEYGNWVLSLGARHDWVDEEVSSNLFTGGSQDASYSEWSFEGGIMYQFDNGISPYYSYAEAFESNGVDSVTGELFDPRTGKQHELGVKYQSPDGNTLITASLFDIEEENRLIGTTSPVVINADYRGAEFQIQHRWHDFYAQASLTYVDAEQTQGGVDLDVPQQPKRQASAWLGYDPQQGALENFRFGLGVRYTDETTNRLNTLDSDSAFLTDAMIGYKWGDIDFQLNVNNVFDREYIAATDSSPLPLEAFGARRTVMLSATYSF